MTIYNVETRAIDIAHTRDKSYNRAYEIVATLLCIPVPLECYTLLVAS